MNKVPTTEQSIAPPPLLYTNNFTINLIPVIVTVLTRTRPSATVSGPAWWEAVLLGSVCTGQTNHRFSARSRAPPYGKLSCKYSHFNQRHEYLSASKKKNHINRIVDFFRAYWLNWPGLCIILYLCAMIGTVIYAFYETCDPKTYGLITASDQASQVIQGANTNWYFPCYTLTENV